MKNILLLFLNLKNFIDKQSCNNVNIIQVFYHIH